VSWATATGREAPSFGRVLRSVRHYCLAGWRTIQTRALFVFRPLTKGKNRNSVCLLSCAGGSEYKPRVPYTLGLGCYSWHEASAVLVNSGQVVAAAEEERFTGKKFDNSFPENAIAFCLKQAGLRS